jgi:hypothetical protein
MRTLLIGVLVATVVGCSCPPLPRQVSMQGCTDADGQTCLGTARGATLATSLGTTGGSSIEQEFSALTAKSAATKTKTAAAKTEKRPSAHSTEKAHHAAETTKPVVATQTAEHPTSDQPAETSDQVIAKAKISVAARLENPTSAEFGDMKRAMRKNTFGQSVDTICGRVKAKTGTGEDIGDRPFLYLVKDDEAYVVDGAPSSAAATAYRNICN